ncbi:unnamed protein product [Rhizoctonia solani]|uniref:Uncharacterized protein n=1 Tax=Rhizoctonia solani TaxID=456999 RepID=A0A8H3H3K1_9AGAM|nr:unnamed protein product [Rhizoctonia solani]
MSLEPNQISGEADAADTSAEFDPGYHYMPYERIVGKSATDILKQVDKILQSTNVVLENHKDYLPEAQFAALKKAYRRYHWQMTNESQEDRAYYDKRISESRILSQLYANRQTHQDRARVLLYKVETFQTKVLSASRNTHAEDALVLFEDELVESPSASRTSTLDSFTSWFSFRRSHSPTSVDPENTSIPSDPAPTDNAEGGEFIVSVTYFPKPGSDSSDGSSTGTQIYKRKIAFENKDDLIEILDPKPYALKGDETYVGEVLCTFPVVAISYPWYLAAENALRATSDIGQSLLGQSDSEIPSDSSITTDTTLQTESLETIIQKFKKIPVARD